MNAIVKSVVLAATLAASAGCSVTPAAQHELACVGGSLTGAVIGGAIGNRFGSGTGQTLATAAGAAAGGITAASAMNC